MTQKFPTSLILNINKEKGVTSFDIIRRLKKIIPGKGFKIGHFGTLDPFANGVLLIGYGHATRLMEYVHKLMPKTYLATGVLGVATNTGDKDGEVIAKEEPAENLKASWTLEKLNQALKKEFIDAEYWQRPPQFSAAKHCGKPLYKWARQGIEIKKEPVLRKIYNIEVKRFDPPMVSFSVTVSTGTYIRTLFEDISKLLGTLGHLSDLERTSVGMISIHDGINQDFWQLELDRQLIELTSKGVAMDVFLPFPKLMIAGEVASKYKNGIPFAINESTTLDGSNGAELSHEQTYWVYGEDSELIGLGQVFDDMVKAIFNLPIVH